MNVSLLESTGTAQSRMNRIHSSHLASAGATRHKPCSRKTTGMQLLSLFLLLYGHKTDT
ncbi:MAG: hypothetical protein J5I83_12105 [Nitrosomonas communis]|nr:hypothetical protein [Nitrosomonas communis]